MLYIEMETKQRVFKKEVKPITLIMRRYYGNDSAQIREVRRKDRYRDDPEYRETIKQRARDYYRTKKLRSAEELKE
jgi:hypothetical protein